MKHCVRLILVVAQKTLQYYDRAFRSWRNQPASAVTLRKAVRGCEAAHHMSVVPVLKDFL